MRFRQVLDRSDWVDHYNALLLDSVAPYFLWLPHDDAYPTDYVETLVDALEADRDAVLAFGVMHSEDVGRGRVDTFSAPPIAKNEPWSPRVAARLFLLWNLGTAFRGVFRREALVDRALFIERSATLSRVDIYWLFGVALAGRLLFVPTASCVKRYAADGVSAAWTPTLRGALDEYRVPARYMRRAEIGMLDRIVVRAALALAAASRAGWVYGRRLWPGPTGSPPAGPRGAMESCLRILLGDGR